MATATYISQPNLKIDGSTASDSLMEDLLQIIVEESLHLPAMFTLVINNSRYSGRSEDSFWKHEKIFEIGKSIEIAFTSSTTESQEFDDAETGTVIKGEVTGIETHFNSESQAPIIIRGYDVSHRLHRGRFNRSFQNITDSDIVKKVIGEVGISSGTVDSTTPTHDYIFQENQTNMEFLRERAARNGYELFVQDGKLNFRKPKSEDTLELTWLKDLHGFRVRVSSAEQVSSVEVRGWDYTKKSPIVATKNSDQVITSTEYGKGKDTSSSFNGKPKSPKMMVVDQPVFSEAEADKIAQALFDELGGEFVHADAKAEGNPKIRPGKSVKLKEMGKYSGSYYVTESRHIYEKRVYTTEFTVRGLRGGDLLDTLSPQVRLQPGQTLMVGQVTDNNDPDGMGRVKVWFPTLTPKEGSDAHTSHWARVVSMGAGKSRGFDCLPEIDDEVLVAFEHGDIHRPYVIGGVWNGKDKAPEKVADSVVDGKVRLRTVKTRTGHTLQFVEEDKDSSKKGVYLDTVYGHKLSCNDSDQQIETKTKEGHKILIDDKNKKMELTTQGGHKVSLDDNGKKIDITSSGDVTIQAGSGKKITLDGKTIEITGQSNITLKVGGSKIEISNAGIKLTQGGNQINMASTGVKIKGSMNADLEGGMNTNIKGGMSVAVSGMSIKLG
ncbi:VgrG-related protein [Spirulina sp. CS-785/01]|uniref:VgrG-related protein n=1 Tax=Spirulina sp. CS-785/01 TaxID=3021716 RepID=UPI00232CC334|nr:VgrG-related protein [Spirulina sp. CS-785/01]MDB9314381.1 VgrG-related protein [Spirulina sp. CS-785/01]